MRARTLILPPILLVGSMGAAHARWQPDPAGAVRISGAAFPVGLAVVELGKGTATPVVGEDSTTVGWIYLGPLRVRAEPPNAIERHQLEMFTGSSVLDVTGDAAVLLAGETTDPPWTNFESAALSEADRLELHSYWRDRFESGEWRNLDVDGALLGAAAGDAALRPYRAALVRSERFGPIHVLLDPREIDRFVAGRFVRFAAGDAAEAEFEGRLRREQAKGKLSTLRVEDWYDRDVWVASSPAGPDGSTEPGSAGFQITDHRIEVRITEDRQGLRGTDSLGIRFTGPPRRVLTLELSPDLVVREARDASGQTLEIVRSGVRVIVLFPGIPEPETRISLTYEGPGIEKDPAGHYELRSTSNWYPRGGEVRRATFDVRLEWPKRLDLLASGDLVESGVGKGTKWERRILEIPALAFSFEVGQFRTVTTRSGDVEIVVAFNRYPRLPPDPMQDSVVATVRDAMAAYQEVFGAYPLKRLTVVTLPRSYAQGFPGFVTLSHELFAGDPRYTIRIGPGESLRVLAHEIAHQWWGNKLGWWSGRDLWLSEGLAEYSATWFTFYRMGQNRVWLRERMNGWRHDLGRRAGNGRPLYWIGPVSLGDRLESSLYDDAYHAIVYRKGAAVLNTLAEQFGEGAFLRALRTLADAVENRVIDSSTFIKAIEKLSGADLGPFSATFIDGTALPEFHWSHEVVPVEGGRWLVHGHVEAGVAPVERWEVRPVGEGGYDTVPVPGPPEAFPLRLFVVPWAARFEADAPGPEAVERGSVVLDLENGSFTVRLSREPTAFDLDPDGALFANFHGRGNAPKTALLRKAAAAYWRGSWEDAERHYRALLDEPSAKRGVAALDDRRRNGAARLGLARIALLRGNDPVAKDELAEAVRELGTIPGQPLVDAMDVVQARIDLRAGRTEKCYDRLARRFRLDFRQEEGEEAAAQFRRMAFSKGMDGDGEAYALLAVSAALTERPEVALRAADEARRRGADVLLPATGSRAAAHRPRSSRAGVRDRTGRHPGAVSGRPAGSTFRPGLAMTERDLLVAGASGGGGGRAGERRGIGHVHASRGGERDEQDARAEEGFAWRRARR